MSDYEGLLDEALKDESVEDMLNRSGECGVCGGWSRPNPPVCASCGRRLCDDCTVEYPDHTTACVECAKEDIDRYESIMLLADREDTPPALVRKAETLFDQSISDVASEDWQPLLDALRHATHIAKVA